MNGWIDPLRGEGAGANGPFQLLIIQKLPHFSARSSYFLDIMLSPSHFHWSYNLAGKWYESIAGLHRWSPIQHYEAKVTAIQHDVMDSLRQGGLHHRNFSDFPLVSLPETKVSHKINNSCPWHSISITYMMVLAVSTCLIRNASPAHCATVVARAAPLMPIPKTKTATQSSTIFTTDAPATD